MVIERDLSILLIGLLPRNFAKKSLLGFETKGYVQVRTDRRFERGIKAYLLRYLLTTTLTGLIRSGVLATYGTFVCIPSIHSGITAIFSAAALQSKKGKGKKKTLLSFFFLVVVVILVNKSRVIQSSR